MGDTPLLGNSYLRSRSSQYKCNIAHLRRTRRRQDDLVRRCKYFPSSYTRDTSGKSHESFSRLKANQRFWIGNAVRYGQDNSVFANMDMYRIENVVCYPFRTATLVDNETIEGQIGEGCQEATTLLHALGPAPPRRPLHHHPSPPTKENRRLVLTVKRKAGYQPTFSQLGRRSAT